MKAASFHRRKKLPQGTNGSATSASLGRNFVAQRDLVSLAIDDRRRHLAILGKTGTGKTTLLQNLIVGDIQAGQGVACIEPHGDLADSLLELVPRSRTNDVVLFDVGDASHPLSFNLLACNDVRQRPLVASGIVSSFKKIYAAMWGPRLEHILRNASYWRSWRYLVHHSCIFCRCLATMIIAKAC